MLLVKLLIYTFYNCFDIIATTSASSTPQLLLLMLLLPSQVHVFCKRCITRNCGRGKYAEIQVTDPAPRHVGFNRISAPASQTNPAGDGGLAVLHLQPKPDLQGEMSHARHIKVKCIKSFVPTSLCFRWSAERRKKVKKAQGTPMKKEKKEKEKEALKEDRKRKREEAVKMKHEEELSKVENFLDENIHEAFDTLNIYQKCLEVSYFKFLSGF